MKKTITVKEVKDISFTGKDGKEISGKRVFDTEGVEYAVYKHAAIDVLQLGVKAEITFDAERKDNKISEAFSGDFREGAGEPKNSSVNASIEAQVAIKEIGEDWRAGKLKDTDPILLGYKQWLTTRVLPIQEETPITETAQPTLPSMITEVEIATMQQMAKEDNVKWLYLIQKKYPDVYAEAKGEKSIAGYLKHLTEHQAEVLILERTAGEKEEV